MLIFLPFFTFHCLFLSLHWAYQWIHLLIQRGLQGSWRLSGNCRMGCRVEKKPHYRISGRGVIGCRNNQSSSWPQRQQEGNVDHWPWWSGDIWDGWGWKMRQVWGYDACKNDCWERLRELIRLLGHGSDWKWAVTFGKRCGGEKVGEMINAWWLWKIKWKIDSDSSETHQAESSL